MIDCDKGLSNNDRVTCQRAYDVQLAARGQARAAWRRVAAVDIWAARRRIPPAVYDRDLEQ